MTVRTPEPAAPLVERLEQLAGEFEHYDDPDSVEVFRSAAATLRAQQEEIARFTHAGYRLAMAAMQSKRYAEDRDYAEATDDVYNLTAARALTED